MMLRWLGNVFKQLMAKNSATSDEDMREPLNPPESNMDEYSNFLLEVLQAEWDNNDPAVVYPILQQHQQLLDDVFAQLLQQWTRNAVSQSNSEEAAAIAGVIANLCIDIQQFPWGSRANNLEIAIKGYETVLEVYTREAFPEYWARSQNNLGNAYSDRIRGERADNLEKAIAAYNLSLEVYTREAFPEDWARTQNNLGNAYSDRIRGERADNLEKAIAAYNLSLEVYTREAFPEDWAMTQNNLGNAYQTRIRGERADNLEKAIAAYNLSLEVRTREAFPEAWARTQNNLGTAYSDRIRGERADNLEKAIAAYNLSLEVRTREAFPEAWARTQNNLGNAYRSRIRGERADNLEKAIAAYNLSLEVYTREAFPEAWATTQNNLGNAYRSRIRGERADNLEKAIAAYNLSLEVYTREAFPEDWARSQNNLGIAYGDRIRGERADNLEKAIAAYNLSLEVYTREAFPEAWARTQNNLGTAYRSRIREERADNLEKAIAAYNLSLEVYTREAFPEYWAGTQNNLGNAYRGRIRGERADNLEKAIAAYNLSLEVYTREAFPEYWATTQNNLGTAYSDRIRGERADNLEKAIAAYNLSLEVYKPHAFPIDCLQTGRNLGDAAKLKEDWDTAIKGYGVAIEAVEQSREWAFLQRNKKEIQTEAIDVYDQHIAACVKLRRLEEAFGTVESNKSRYLIELLAAINIIIPNDATEEQRNIYNEYKTLRRHIDTLGLQAEDLMKSEIRSQKSEVVQVVDQTISITPEKQSSFNKQQLISDRRRLNELLEDIQTFAPDFTATQRIERVKLSEIQGILDPKTVIWEWYITPPQQESKDYCFYTFIITHNHIDVVKSNSEELDKLIDWKDDYLEGYEQGEWNNFTQKLESLWERLLIPQLLEKTPDECEKLVLIPHQYLHIFPIHAVSGKINNQPLTLQQRFQQGIQYIPSCQLLKRLHKKFRLRQKKANNTPFFGIQNPTLDLKYSDLEVESIKKKFVPNAFILRREQATKTELNKSDTIKELSQSYYVHFACHGAYNFQSPLDSALCLAGSKKTPQPSDRQREQETSRNTITLRDGESYDIEKSLRLQDIFETINLPQCYLVILSACETGLTTFEPNIDEYLGLGSGFLYAGSLHVINTLWRINDFVTAIFMIYCYQEIVDNNQPIPIALQNSQKWIREAKASKIMEWFEDLEKKEIIDKNTKYDMITVLQRDYYEQDPPFQNPTYWAAFCSLGLIH